MRTKFTEVANKLRTIKSGFAEAISAKGVDTAPNAPFSTMIENIGNITFNGESIEPEPEEWIKPHDWIDIEAEPLEAGEIRVLMCDQFGSDGNAMLLARRWGANEIKANIDWGDGTQEEVNVKEGSVTVSHSFQGEGIWCDRGYYQYVVKIKFNDPASAPNSINFYRIGSTANVPIYNNILWIYGDFQYLVSLSSFTRHNSYGSNSVLLERFRSVNTSHITDMNTMFFSCSLLKSVTEIDASSATNISNMFQGCHSLESVSLTNTEKVTNMSNTFQNCYSLLKVSLGDTSKVTNMSGMFRSCMVLTEAPNLNTCNVTNTSAMFYECYNLRSIPHYDTSNVTIINDMFSKCSSLEEVPQLDTSKATNMSNLFFSCTSLKAVPSLNTSSATNLHNIFSSCYLLKYIPPLDTSNATTMSNMFNSCHSLVETPIVDTSKATTVNAIYGNNASLRVTSPLDLRASTNVTGASNIFTNSVALREIGTITLSKYAKIAMGSVLARLPLTRIDFAYDEFDPPKFTETVPIQINYTQLTAEQLNKLMEQLPDGNGKTLDLKYNVGSNDCDPSIATAKNWTVLLK